MHDAMDKIQQEIQAIFSMFWCEKDKKKKKTF